MGELEPRVRADVSVESCPETDRCSQRFSEQRRHPSRDGTRGNTPRLQHQ